jgi:acetyltransferase-like isoleucine patch superfamily enzyme
MNHAFPYSKFESHLFRLYRLLVFKPFLKKLGSRTFISPYAIIQNLKCISIGDHSFVGRGTLVQPIVKYLSENFNAQIEIQNNVYIGNHCTITATNEIIIENGVTIGDQVYIGGGRHGYEDCTLGVLQQNLVLGSVRIRSQAWVGYGSFIAGAGHIEIGEHAIIAANSVVTRSVPPFTIVAGAPAKPVKYYNFSQEKWMAIEASPGSAINNETD